MGKFVDVFKFLFLISMPTYSAAKPTRPPESVQMKVQNNAGAPIELFWINTFVKEREIVKQTTTPIRNGTDTVINSYDTHQFMVKFLKDLPGVSANFTKGPLDEVVSVFYDPKVGMYTEQTTKHDEIKTTVKQSTTTCTYSSGSTEEYVDCVAEGVLAEMTKISDSKDELTKYRDLLSERLRNYTCADPQMKTSEPISTSQTRIGNVDYNVNTYLNMPRAKILSVDDFVTEEECDVLMKFGKPKLKRATVAADDGSSIVSENRKAQQAAYNFHGDPEKDPLWNLYNRVFAFANSFTGFDLRPPGQEEFTIIQYNVDDQYTPHCDGTCDGTKHIKHGRVATAVLYCQVADQGGATTFTKSDIFINPTPGMATFFSYKGLDGLMDEGYTEHSGCPVLAGEKWITTVWMREGVNESDYWGLYDPNGVKLLENE